MGAKCGTKNQEEVRLALVTGDEHVISKTESGNQYQELFDYILMKPIDMNLIGNILLNEGLSVLNR